jgi:nitronate monooxygenase
LTNYPRIIQGGMGIGVSNWRLAREVSRLGQLGVVSGTGLDVILSRRLQDGDPGGHMRRALDRFPIPEIGRSILDTYYLPGGRPAGQPYRSVDMYTVKPSRATQALSIASNFVEVYLAKEGHGGVVGINYLEKIQMPFMPAVYGAMLGGVDYVLMGAGIPRQVPAILDHLAVHEEVSLRLNVEGASSEETFRMRYAPEEVMGRKLAPIKRPLFLPIISSATLAVSLVRKASSRVDGFVVEGPLAGGHNAPPRDGPQLNERGEPLYGDSDEVDFPRIKSLGLPFWIAGSWADPEKLQEAESLGAQGIQVGTAFAFCAESAIDEKIKRDVLAKAIEGDIDVFTDPRASPSGFPFKVVRLAGTVSEPETYAERKRICDLCWLRSIYKKVDSTLGYRCASDAVDTFLAKGGKLEQTKGRKCICNGLLTLVGLGQLRDSGRLEKAIVTAGDDLKRITRFLKKGQLSYSARDVLTYLLGAIPSYDLSHTPVPVTAP